MSRPAAPDGDVTRGIELFAARRYHAAHSAFERAWMARGRAAPAIQGLVQIAAACVHLEHGRSRPADRLLRRAREKLVADPTAARHVRLDTVLASLDRCLHAIRDRADVGSRGPTPRSVFPTVEGPLP